MSVNSKMTAIADAIREKTGGTDLLNLDGMATGVNDVYEAGKATALKAISGNYTRKNYNYALNYTDFSGLTFDETVKPTSVDSMFHYYVGEYIPSGFDLSDVPVTNTSGQWFCRYAKQLKYFPDINYPAQTRYAGTWQGCYVLETIEIVRSDESSIYGVAFGDCKNLKNITFEGVIGQNISFDTSTKLTAESIANIVEHLSDTAEGMTLTLSQTAVNNADWTNTDYADWATLIATKTNWTFSLV